MLPLFCLRLATGLIAGIFVLDASQVNPRFFRTQLLTALGLCLVAAGFAWSWTGIGLLFCIVTAAIFCLLGAVSWSLERSPGALLTAGLALCACSTSLLLARQALTETSIGFAGSADEISSALLLGMSITSMLMGHSYLIAPTMSIRPLMSLLLWMGAAITARACVAGWGIWSFSDLHSLARLNDVTLLLPIRWGLGFVGPAVLGVLAWQTAKLRSTQSATGILYVVVIFCFLGELLSQVLQRMTGFAYLF